MPNTPVDFFTSIQDSIREPLLILDSDLKVIKANRSFYKTFSVEPEETEGLLIYELGNRQWDIPQLRELLEEILPENTWFNDFEVEHNFETIGRKIMHLNARRIYGKSNRTRLVLLAIEDVTERGNTIGEGSKSLSKSEQQNFAPRSKRRKQENE